MSDAEKLTEWRGLAVGDEVRIEGSRARYTFRFYFRSETQEYVELSMMSPRVGTKCVRPETVRTRKNKALPAATAVGMTTNKEMEQVTKKKTETKKPAAKPAADAGLTAGQKASIASMKSRAKKKALADSKSVEEAAAIADEVARVAVEKRLAAK